MTFATKDDALDALETARAEWLDAARTWAVEHASDGFPITIEDVRRDGPALPEGVDPRVCGAVFRDRGLWSFNGYIPGKRRTSHNRPVAQYVLRGAE